MISEDTAPGARTRSSSSVELGLQARHPHLGSTMKRSWRPPHLFDLVMHLKAEAPPASVQHSQSYPGGRSRGGRPGGSSSPDELNEINERSAAGSLFV